MIASISSQTFYFHTHHFSHTHFSGSRPRKLSNQLSFIEGIENFKKQISLNFFNLSHSAGFLVQTPIKIFFIPSIFKKLIKYFK